jgi:putative endonuclease
MHIVYVLECSDGTLYVGHTSDLRARLAAHNDGTASNYTAPRRPVRLMHAERHPCLAAAVKREHQLNRWSGRKKRALINGDRATLKALSKRRH